MASLTVCSHLEPGVHLTEKAVLGAPGPEGTVDLLPCRPCPVSEALCPEPGVIHLHTARSQGCVCWQEDRAGG